MARDERSVLGAAAGRGFPVDTVLAACALVVVWLVVLPLWIWGEASISDVPLYHSYAVQMSSGSLPYAELGLEYPPVAVGIVLAAAATGLSWPEYSAAFGILMLIFAVVCLVAVDLIARTAGLGTGRRRLALAGVVVAPLMLGSVFRTRFDLVPTAIVAIAVLLAMKERWIAAFALVGIGTMTKIFPLVLAPLFVAYLLGRRRAGDAIVGVAVMVAVIVLISVPPLMLSPSGYADSYAFQLERPVQIESTPAALLFLADGLGIGSVEVTGTIANPDRFKSQGLEGPLAGGLSTVTSILAIAGALAILWCAFWIGRLKPHDGLSLVVAALGLLLAMVALGPVLSPQFLIWLVPLTAVVAGAGLAWIAAPVLVALVLTLIEFPVNYGLLVERVPWVIALVAARDLAVVVALAAALLELRRSLRSARQVTPAGPVPTPAESIGPIRADPSAQPPH